MTHATRAAAVVNALADSGDLKPSGATHAIRAITQALAEACAEQEREVAEQVLQALAEGTEQGLVQPFSSLARSPKLSALVTWAMAEAG